MIGLSKDAERNNRQYSIKRSTIIIERDRKVSDMNSSYI